MREVILFGGSFDPVHQGHLEIARNALKEMKANEVWFLLAAISPFKEESTSFENRKHMLEMMLENEENISICTIEQDLPKPSYSIDTVKALKKKHPMTKFYWLIGSDQIKDLSKWKDFKTLNTLVEFIVYQRPGYMEEHPYRIIQGKMIEVSSTEIRQGTSFLTKPSILKYMMEENLYLKTLIKHTVSTYRYEHTLRVTELALKIAKKHGLEEKKMTLIAMCHDICKEARETILNQVMESIYPDKLSLPQSFYHAYAASYFLQEKFHIKDQDVLEAIENHVSGTSNNPYAMVLFIADKCEPGRKYDASDALELSMKDLKLGFKYVKKQNEDYVKEKQWNY